MGIKSNEEAMKYLGYYIILILVLLFIAPKIKRAFDTERVVVTTVDSVDTSAFQEGQIVTLDEVGCVRIVFPRDSTSRILGIVTRCDTIGEITLKYISVE